MDPWKVEGVTMTSEELVERSPSWTLACDNAVLNKLKILSEEVHKNSLAIKQDCESLTEDVTRVQSRLSNITNKFLMISNTQFVENRVEEFEEADVAAEVRSNQVARKVKTKQEKEAELLKKMKEAIQIGINACSSSSSSARERRQMPHLIGSSKFFSSQYVGLRDPTTVPVSFGDNNSLPVEDSFGSIRTQQSFPVVTSSASQEKPKVSLPQVNQSSITNFQPPVPYNENNYAQETNAYEESSVIKQPSTTSSQERFSNPEPTVDKSQIPVQVTSDEGPPPLDMSDESDDDFKPQSSASGHGRLFVDDEDDDDLFNDRSLFPPKPKADINNLFFGKNSAEVKPPVPVISPPPYNQKYDEDDLSNQVKDESKPAVDYRKLDVGVLPDSHSPNPIISNRATQVKEQSEMDKSSCSSEKGIDKPHIKIPPGAVSVFGKLPPEGFPSLKNNKERANHNQQATNVPRTVTQAETNTISSSSENNCSKVNTGSTELPVNNDDQNPSTNRSSSLTSKLKNHSSQGSLGSEPSKSVLFDSDSDEDLFFSTKKKPTSRANKSSSLFTKSLSEQNKSNIVTTEKSPKPHAKSSLFDDSDSGDDLFSSASSSSSKNKQTALLKTKEIKENTEKSARIKVTEPPVKSSGLFGDDSDSDSDLFASLNRKTKSNVSNHSTTATEKAIPTDSKIRIMATEDSLDILNRSSSLDQNDLLDLEHEEKIANSNNLGENNSIDPSIEHSSPVSDEIDSVAPLLVNLVKGRPKGQPNRRPPSKQFGDAKIKQTVLLTTEEKITEKTDSITVTEPPVKSSGLFGNDSDSDSDLFASLNKKTKSVVSSNSSIVTAKAIPTEDSLDILSGLSSLEHNDSLDLEQEKKIQNSNTLGEKKSMEPVIAHSSSVYDEIDFAGPLLVHLVKGRPKGQPNRRPPSKLASTKNKHTALTEENTEKTDSIPVTEPPVKSSGLFGDDSDSDSDLFVSLNKKTKSIVTNNSIPVTEKATLTDSKIRIMTTEDSLDILSSLEHKDHLDLDHEKKNNNTSGESNSVEPSIAHSSSVSDEIDSVGPLLVNLVKGRPKGQPNRRPPSKLANTTNA